MTANAHLYTFVVVAQPQQYAQDAHNARAVHDDWRINAEGSLFRARIGGQVVWATRLMKDSTPTVYITHEQASALGLCHCGKAAEYIGFEGLRCGAHKKCGMSILCTVPGCTQVSDGGFSYACKAHKRTASS